WRGGAAAKELQRDQAKGREGDLLVQDGFDMRDAAARRMRRETPDQPRRNRRRGGAHGDDKTDPEHNPMRAQDRRFTQPVGLFKAQPEHRADEARPDTDQQRQQRQRQQTALACGGVYSSHLQFPLTPALSPQAGRGRAVAQPEKSSCTILWKTIAAASPLPASGERAVRPRRPDG